MDTTRTDTKDDTNRPRVGVLLPTREQAMAGSYAAAPLLTFAREAELLGFDSLWTGESLIARPRLDPYIVLAAVAAATERVTIGTAALTPALRHPMIGANMLASLDHVSGGRLVAGLGSGFPIPETEREFAAVGAPFTGRAGRLDDYVRLWRKTWRGADEYSGRHLTASGLRALPGPATPGGPPLWLAGSNTPAVLRRVARLYDGWLPFLPDADTYGRAWRQLRDNLTAEGRPTSAVTPGLYATITVGADRGSARAELEDYVQGYYGRTLEQMSAIQAYCWGSQEECAQWLAGYVRAGARHVVVRIGSLTPGTQLKEIAEGVVPAVRDNA